MDKAKDATMADLERLLEKNPQISRDSLERTQQRLRDLRQRGLKRPNFLAASPPVDPYSRAMKVRR